jgi:hypothetical protein
LSHKRAEETPEAYSGAFLLELPENEIAPGGIFGYNILIAYVRRYVNANEERL